MKLSEILLPDQLKKLQQGGYAGKKIYIPKIQQQMSKNLIIARYKKFILTIKRTPAIEILYKETGISRRNLYRITKDN